MKKGRTDSRRFAGRIFLRGILLVGLPVLVGSGCDSEEGAPPAADGEPKTWFEDSDGDGYGNPERPVLAVAPPAGYVQDGTDCNDRAFTVHPGSYEICQDGVDQDCDGEDLALAGIAHAQGEMAGEVTVDSVILQSRLTAGCRRLYFDAPGTAGVARFEVATTPDFGEPIRTGWISAVPEQDHIVREKVTGLSPGTRYYYRLQFGRDTSTTHTGPACTFRTLDLPETARAVEFVVVTGMNYFPFHIFPGPPNKHLGYPALETILKMTPDFFVGTGDNVYYDAFAKPARTQADLRKVWHLQFLQPRFLSLFSRVPAYWEKDDHDHRYNDSDTTGDTPPSNELGIRTFLEQMPVVGPDEEEPLTYRTHRINKLLQIWLTEGRDYRSPNTMEDGPEKTLWGETQREWLMETLLESDATFKLLISPTPMVGPDDTFLPWPYTGQPKVDNHTNPAGFKHEGEAFFAWLGDNGFLAKNFYIICGDRHWQYHSIRPDGFEEFSCGALVDANSRLGRAPGDPESTDPEGEILQPFTQTEASGGFLFVTVRPAQGGNKASCAFTFYDENGQMLYTTTRFANESGD